MNKFLLTLITVISVYSFKGQTFTGSGFTTTSSGNDCVDITVSGLPGSIDGTFGLTEACIDINHNYTENLLINLVAPDGTVFPLSTGNGSSGDDYSNTCFSPSATQSIEGAAAPFNGSFVPEGCNWSQNLNNGQNPNGLWQLCVSGQGTGGAIDVTVGSVTFGSTTGQGFNEASDECADATPICSLDGYYGTTSACYNDASIIPSQNPVDFSSFCGSIENNGWLQFEAAATQVDIEVLVGNCNVGNGIQFALYEDLGCTTFTYANSDPSNCYSPINPGTNNISFTGLTIGNSYVLMIDGNAGDICDYQVTALGGIAVTTIESSLGDTICPGQTTTLSVNAVGGTPTGYTWYEGATILGTNPTIDVTPTAQTTYTVEVAGACGALNNLSYTVTPYNWPVTFSGLPATMQCDDSPVVIATDDVNTTPCIYIVIDAVNIQTGNSITLYEDGAAYWGTNNLTANTISTNTFYQASPADPHFIELINTNIGANMPYEVRDCHTDAVLASGIWDASTTGTTTISLTGTISGSATWSSTCGSPTLIGASAFSDVMDWGTEVFDPSQVSGPFPTTCDVTYTWNSTTGCSGSETNQVTITSPHDASFNYVSSGLFCSDASDPSPIITGTGTGTFSSTTGLTINTNTGEIDLSASTPGSYMVSHSVGTGTCTDTKTFDIEILAPPTSNAGTDFDITCITNIGGSMIGTSSTAGLSYSWTPTTGLSSSTVSNPNANPSNSTTYEVTTSHTTLPSCSSTDQVDVNVDNTQPNTSVITPVTVDCNDTIAGGTSLDGSASDQGNNITYSWSTTNGVIDGDTNLDTAATNVAGNYLLSITNIDNGCSSSATVVVSEDFVAPSADAGTDINFPCGVTFISLDGSNSTGTGITHNWTGPGTINNGTTGYPDINTTGTFSLTVTASNGCIDTDDVNVIPDANVPIADAGNDIIINCSNYTSPLSINLDGSGSDVGMTYTWNTITGTGNITNGSSTTPTVDNEGSYEIHVLNTSNNCFSTDTVDIILDTINPIADAGTSATINCLPPNVLVSVLDGTNSSGTGISYSWTGPGNINNGNTASPTVDEAGTYTLTVTGSNNCSDNSDVVVTIDTITPIISIATPATLNCNVTNITLDASGTTGSNPTYSWSSGGNNTTEQASNAGSFTLTVTNDNGCSSIETVTVIDAPSPVADFDATPTSGAVPLVIDLTNNSTGSNLTYDWSFDDGNNSNNIDTTYTYNSVGNFTITLVVTDEYGCTDSDSVLITTEGESVLIIPNIFSPNGDDINDIFNLQGENIESLNGIILNRWGQVVFEWKALEAGWDGRTQSGREAAEGTYFYIITAEGVDGTLFDYNGPIQLVR